MTTGRSVAQPPRLANANWVRHLITTAALVATAAPSGVLHSSARADLVFVPHGCHSQQTNFYCGFVSIEMMHDRVLARIQIHSAIASLGLFPATFYPADALLAGLSCLVAVR